MNTSTKTLALIKNDTALKYSENKKQLKQLLDSISIQATPYQVPASAGSMYKDSIAVNALKYKVVIVGNNGQIIDFDFNCSMMDSISFDSYSLAGARILMPHEKNIMRLEDGFRRIAQTNRKKHNDDLLYSILCCIGVEYYIEPIFDDFCSDFGYDEDSMKARDLHQICLKQSQKLHQIFNDADMECMPS